MAEKTANYDYIPNARLRGILTGAIKPSQTEMAWALGYSYDWVARSFKDAELEEGSGADELMRKSKELLYAADAFNNGDSAKYLTRMQRAWAR